MFKQLVAYRPGKAGGVDADALAAGLEKSPFQPCGPTQPLAVGWVPPRGEPHAPLLERIAGVWATALRFEQRLLPASVVREHAEARAAQIERQTGRRPGKREMRELKEEVTVTLLPQAFTKQATVHAWIAPGRGAEPGWLWLDAGSQPRLDAALTALVHALPSLAPMALHTAESPAVAMRDWLASGEPPRGFSVDQDCEFKAPDETRAAVRYARHPLDPQDVQRHLDAGLMPTRLALTWRDRVSLVLTESLQLKRLALLDVVLESGGTDAEAGFEADVALLAGELGGLLPELLDALGGEASPGTA